MIATYFTQQCTTCGIGLKVSVKYLGKEMSCPHCKANFHAIDPTNPVAPVDEQPSLLERAERLLFSLEQDGIAAQ